MPATILRPSKKNSISKSIAFGGSQCLNPSFFGNSNSLRFILITRLRGVDEHVAEVYCRLVEGLTGPQGRVTTSLVPHKHLKLLTIFFNLYEDHQ